MDCTHLHSAALTIAGVFSEVHGTFSTTDRGAVHNARFNKYKKVK
jgi:hypothetical protein